MTTLYTSDHEWLRIDDDVATIGITDYAQTQLGDVIGCLKVAQERPDDDVIDDDLILVWGSQRRIITGSDLLGRLLRGIANVEAGNPARQGTVALLQS